MKLDELIDDINNCNIDKYLPYFGNDYQLFFTFLNKKKLLDLVPLECNNSGDWVNEYLLFLYKNNLDRYYYYTTKLLGDVVQENGEFYLVIGDKTELSELFCDTRSISRKGIERILSDDFYDYFDSFGHIDIFSSVISELNDKNLSILNEIVVKNLDGIEIPLETDLLESISEEQGNEGYALINNTNIRLITDDEDTMNYLLDNDLYEIKTELSIVYSDAYSSAYNSELYGSIFDKLSEYFIGRGEYFQVYNKNNKLIYDFKIKIKDYEKIINSYLELNKDNGYYGTLEYSGNFFTILRADNDCLRFYPPDYPSYNDVSNNINEYFTDRIH